MGEGRRQVAVPVVEGQARHRPSATGNAHPGVADHGHSRIGESPLRGLGRGFGGVDVGGGNQLLHFVPAGAHKAT